MTKTRQCIRGVEVNYLLPNEDAFKELGFGFSKIENGYKVFSIPQNWKKKKAGEDYYLIFDDKSRCRGYIVLSKHDNLTSYFVLQSVVDIGVASDGEYCSCTIVIDDDFNKISGESYIEIEKFSFPESEFDKARAEIFDIAETFWLSNVLGVEILDDEDETLVDKNKIIGGLEKAASFLDEKLPGWRDPTLYWD